MSIRFKFAARKAFDAIHWMVSEYHDIDLHAALKACYFADKSHLNEHARPIFGATYRAMRFGPVPLEIYEMMKGEALWKAELGTDIFPWELSGYRLRSLANEHSAPDSLSESDIEHLKRGAEQSMKMDFNARTAATHGPDWQRAELGIMRYEDMIDDGPDKDAVIEYLRENARFIKL
jgi:hypothetical protein